MLPARLAAMCVARGRREMCLCSHAGLSNCATLASTSCSLFCLWTHRVLTRRPRGKSTTVDRAHSALCFHVHAYGVCCAVYHRNVLLHAVAIPPLQPPLCSVLCLLPAPCKAASQRTLRAIAVLTLSDHAPLLQESLHRTVAAAAHGRDAADRPKAHLLDACRAARERRFALGLPVRLSAH